ncbi:Rossmann-like fold-containing protein [Aliiglaciecola sp. SL4]|uniref:Rossmann-like fold-containing protein n=1 Tax=Aliiglaciecola sp. SL4 TaxID=3239806 RepID=UPI00355AE54F
MYLHQDWRVLTVGDGDLSFSWSIFKDLAVTQLTASVLDDKDTLAAKYSQNQMASLNANGVKVFHGLDICDKDCFPASLYNAFDLVIFQFPLIPAFSSKAEFESKGKLHKNTLNRLLIWRFLQHSFDYFLDPKGKQLAYVTSKDVKPYSHWNIENLTPNPQQVGFKGWVEFQQLDFPSYQLRNVDRDKVLKSTASKTYVWGNNHCDYAELNLTPSNKHQANYCNLCGKGPFFTEDDRQVHTHSAFHLRLAGYEQLWQAYLTQNEQINLELFHSN